MITEEQEQELKEVYLRYKPLGLIPMSYYEFLSWVDGLTEKELVDVSQFGIEIYPPTSLECLSIWLHNLISLILKKLKIEDICNWILNLFT